jgi:hypothetical protein
MTKYRIVERNKNRWGDYSSYPYYFLQVKIFDLFWIDYCKYPFAEFNGYSSYSLDLPTVENFYQELIMEKQEPYKQTVVKTFYDEDT